MSESTSPVWKWFKVLVILLLLVGSNYVTYHLSYFLGNVNCEQEE